MFHYELKRREKDCAHYYCLGIVESEGGEFTLEPSYPSPKAGEIPIWLGWDEVNDE